MKQWKIGRLSSGIILIALGILLILTQINGLTYFEQLIKWWPVVLILLGGELLLGAFLSGSSKVKISIDLKSIFLTIFIIIFVFCASVVQYAYNHGWAFLDAEKWFSAYKNEKTVVKNFSFDKKDSIDLQNTQGKIVFDKSESGKIEIEASISISYNSEEVLQQIAQDSVKIADGTNIKISTDKSSKNYFKDGALKKVDYLVKVPKDVKFQVRNSNGDIFLSDLENTGKLETQNGNIQVKKSKGDIEVSNSYGSINFEDIQGNIKVNNKNGSIEGRNITGNVICTNNHGSTTFNNITGELDFNGDNGEIDVKEIASLAKIKNKYGKISIANAIKGVNIDSSNGAIDINNEKQIDGDITVYSKYGDVSILSSKDQSLTFKVSAIDGNIDNNLGLKSEKKGDRHTLGGDMNGGKHLVLVDVSSGNVNINN